MQWSRQALDEIMERQERYRASGICCLWLLRRLGIPAMRELPAATIGGSLESGFQATIDTGIGEQTLPMPSFLDAVFAGRFRFGLPPEGVARVSVRAGSLCCWKCGAETRIVTGIDVDLDRGRLAFTVPTLGEHPGPLKDVLDRLPTALEIGAVRRRYSGTQGRRYMSNGCRHCDSLMGGHYEHHAWQDQETVLTLPIRICPAWRRALVDHPGYQPGWSIRPRQD